MFTPAGGWETRLLCKFTLHPGLLLDIQYFKMDDKLEQITRAKNTVD